MTIGITVDAVLERRSDGIYDMALEDSGDIKTENFFDTSILMSLFCEKRASSFEMPASHLRRGWIGNESTPNFEIGSKLWLFEQARLTRVILNGINSEAKNSLKWMVEDGIAKSVTAKAILGSSTQVILDITITRPNSKIEKRNFDLWENTGQ